jgi:hypothetical protein
MLLILLPSISTHRSDHPNKIWSKSKLCCNRRSVGQSVCVSSTCPVPNTIFLLLSHSFGPSLMRGWVCLLKLVPALASAVILRSETYFLSQICDFPNLEGQSLTPQVLGSLFVASCDSQGYGGGIQTHLHGGRTKYGEDSYRPIRLRLHKNDAPVNAVY